MNIQDLIEEVIGREGGYSNHPSDPGGETMWGITKRVAVANGYSGPMRNLPRSTAADIYYREYAVKPGFAAVAAINAAVGFELFDSGVNVGVARPPLWFQEWLNAFNMRGKHYADIKEDGSIGPVTLTAFKAFLQRRGVAGAKVMVAALNSDQAAHYKRITRANEKNEDFTYGWIANRVAA
ncbi:glycoside hydrolase family 108 protein [Sphingobium cupriresistens]|uniref:glycoside hydrolase family 108 protein n=1 Tax=Sphingobium cupriresistens TaxID=1132417 RepID=UPI003BADFB3C